MNEATLNRLRYRRQFLFGPRPVSLEGEWQTHRFGAEWVLTVQRDLPVRCAQAADGAQLVLLGFLIDPDFPELNDQQLFGRLCQCRGWEELLQATVGLSGRWVVFHIAQRRVRVVNDATALRSVYYSVAGQEPWCFSQPGLYRRVQPVEYSREALEHMGSRECQKDFEAVWPAAGTPYAEVAHLLANHYLDLETRRTTRFWPTVPLEAVELERAVAEGARILQQSIRAMAARGPVGFALTAGRDSRTLLAASRAVADRLWVHTGIYGELNRTSPDLRVSSGLCQVAGLEHHLLPCPQAMSEPFKRVFMNNHDPAHAVWGRICEGLLAGYPAPEMMCVRGNVSELFRCVYYPTGMHPATVQASDLARVCKLPQSEFARRHFGAWLEDAAPMAELGYKLLDLFFLEHRMPNWLSVSQTQYDIVYDTFSPYSNRRLFSLVMPTPPAARIKPACTLYWEWIKTMWPELQPFPFNPPETPVAKFLHKARKAQRQIGAALGWRPFHVRLEWHGPKAKPESAGGRVAV